MSPLINNTQILHQYISNCANDFIDVKANAIPFLVIGTGGIIAGACLQQVSITPLTSVCIFSGSAVALVIGVSSSILGYYPHVNECFFDEEDLREELLEVNIE